MSGKVAGKVWDLDLPRPKKYVLLAMANFANGHGGSVKPSVKTIAAQTGYSERHVARIINDLRKDGYIALIKSGKTDGKPNEYKITVESESKDHPAPEPSEGSALTPTPASSGYDIASYQVGHSDRGGMTSESHTGYDIQMSDDPPLIQKAAAAAPASQALSEKPRHNAFVMYEQNIGMLSQIVGEQIKDALKHYPDGWVEDAIREAALNHAKSWRYIERILQRWEREGRVAKAPANGNGSKSAVPKPPRTFDPNCSKCHGQGAVLGNFDDRHPLYGRSIPCPNCQPDAYKRFIEVNREVLSVKH